jgi:hypothetical protein
MCLATGALMQHAKILTGGLYFDTSRASFPLSVRTMISCNFSLKTAEQAAEATASAVPNGGGVISSKS